MMGDIKLKIRHAKRGNEKALDLSNLGITELPIDITQLTMLESLNVSNNKLVNLKRLEQLPNLRVINASNNQITSLNSEVQDMLSLDTLYLFGNPIVNNYPQLAKIENNYNQLKKALESYFGGSNISSLGAYPSNQPSIGTNFGSVDNNFGGNQKQASFGSQGPQITGGAAFLQGDKDMNDPAMLRKRIGQLELENKKLKEQSSSSYQQFSSSFQGPSATSSTGRVNMGEGKDWMKSLGGPLDRPTTAANTDKVKDLQEELKLEKKEKKRLQDEVENLHKELQKSNFSAFTQGAGTISTSSGRLPQVPGVREIQEGDLEIGEKIAQGGFSVLHKGTLNGTPVAIKKIFDPRLTDELLYEIYNEIVMQSILRHPNVALLMGVIPKIPNIVIVFEYMSQGSLYNLLHLKKSFNITLDQRLKIARDVALVYQYMHSLGIVHRDLKSHNVLIDEQLNIKVCDFGLARFKADLNKGTMQYSGTPAYMSPELFQKRQYDDSVDIFAFGTMLWELVTREVPYDGLDPADIRAKVEKEEPLKAPYGTDQKLVSLINECRQLNTANRPRFDRILLILNQFVPQK